MPDTRSLVGIVTISITIVRNRKDLSPTQMRLAATDCPTNENGKFDALGNQESRHRGKCLWHHRSGKKRWPIKFLHHDHAKRAY